MARDTKLVRARDRPAGDRGQLRQAQPADADAQPGHVRGRRRLGAHDDPVLQGPELVDDERERVHRARGVVPLVHGAVRELRRSDRRGPRQGAGRHAAQDAVRDRRPPPACPTARSRSARAPRSTSTTRSSSAAGEVIPSDGEVIEGIASVDESAITGESAPVIRESGGDRSAVTGGTRVLSDEIVVRITARPGETFIDRMIALVEGSSRQKTPNEIALNILLAGLTIIFLLATVTLQPFAMFSDAEQTGRHPGRAAGVPDPDDDRRAALGDRHRGHGPAGAAQRARDERPRGRGRGRLRDAAARQDRHDHLRQPAGRRLRARRRGHGGRSWPTPRSSRASPTRRPKGARSWCSPRSATASATRARRRRRSSPFTAQTRMSGVDFDGPAGAQGRGRLGPALGRGPGRRRSRAARRRRRRDRGAGGHPARRRRGGRGGHPPSAARSV